MMAQKSLLTNRMLFTLQNEPEGAHQCQCLIYLNTLKVQT